MSINSIDLNFISSTHNFAMTQPTIVSLMQNICLIFSAFHHYSYLQLCVILLASVCIKYFTSVWLYFQVPQDFEFSVYELDWIVFSRHMRGAVNLIPRFETAGIKGTVCGAESFTPDHKPLLGQYKVELGAH